jgi:hypothetical protein
VVITSHSQHTALPRAAAAAALSQSPYPTSNRTNTLSQIPQFQLNVMNSNLPHSSSDSASSEEGDTFDESASSLTFRVEEKSGRWVGPHAATRLRFADHDDVQATTGLHEYTPEEIEQCWMDDLDEADAQDEIVTTVMHMRKPPEGWWRWLSSQGDNTDRTKTTKEQEEIFSRYLEEELGLCARGIEHMKSKELREARQMRRKVIAQVVLDEQEVRLIWVICPEIVGLCIRVKLSPVSSHP